MLVREGTVDQRMEVYAEPWVKPMRRAVYVQASIETPSSRNPVFLSEPVELIIERSEPTASEVMIAGSETKARPAEAR